MRKEEFYKIIPKEEIKKLVKEIELPSFIYFKKIIKRKYEELLNCLPTGFEIHYAFKANPNQDVLKFIQLFGVGADVASLGELRLALATGYPTEKIEFTGPGKTIEELSLAIDLGISSINVESISEIEKILNLCRAKKKSANVGIRLNPIMSQKVSAMKMGGDTQFGIIENDLKNAFIAIEKESSHLRFSGLHMHLGSQFLEAGKLISNFRFILEKVYEIANQHKIEVKKINFGGGLGIDIFGNKPPLDLLTFKSGLYELFSNSKYKAFFKNTKFIIEPGRFLVAECGIYAVEVLYRKKGYQKDFLVVNGGMHQNYMAAGGICQVIRRNLQVDVFSKTIANGKNIIFTVTGSLCVPDDILASELELDSNTNEGDLLLFFNSGAYAFSASPLLFLSHPLPIEILI